MNNPPSSSSSSCDPGPSNSVAVRKRLTSPYSGDFGEYFSQQYSVLKLVLSYLNYYDLNTLRSVNTSLKMAADILLKKRIWIQSGSLNYLQGTDHRPEPIHTKHFIDLKIEPQVLFTFEGVAGSPSSRSRPKICMRLRDRNDDRFFPKNEIVPNSVKTFIPIASKGIIYPEKNDKNELIIVQTMLHKKLVLLYLPTKDNFEVSVFTQVFTTESFEMGNIRRFFLNDHRPVQGVLFLKIGPPHVEGIITYIVSLISTNQSEPFAVSGGHVSSLDYDNPPKKNFSGVLKAIVFRGTGIRCMSDFIGATTNDGVLAGLKHASLYVDKTFGKLNVHKTFIIMFQCIDRNALPIEDYTLLAKIFPGIPIFGLQTWGEIGFRSYNPHGLTFIPKKRKLNIIHSVKTTYMLVTMD
ncbi:uncharacterized protein LOC112693915 [Sipha flava]|uniref:Uncharacterized protein LOC112693915 n=1 Tax=Sipha flava TaxID=143950 RepID=A0A8B8GPM6_9HEMI|nr:uncharacterized protein LOC112693915 [Sipha flava]XP_025424975.1 uncharacterized protein LOC112693915 [Sipha flava]